MIIQDIVQKNLSKLDMSEKTPIVEFIEEFQKILNGVSISRVVLL